MDGKTKESKSAAFFYRNSWYHRRKDLMPDGTTKYSRVGGFKTPEEADESYKIYLAKYEEQVKEFAKQKINKDANIDDFFVYWCDSIYKYQVDSYTYMAISYAVYNLIIPNLPYKIKTNLITSEYIELVLESINELGKTLANKCREVFNLALKYAVVEKFLSDNPVEHVKYYRRGKTRITIFKKDEIEKFLKITCKENWYLEILLAMFCGMRKGEIMGLKFSDIDFENDSLYIQRQLSAKCILERGTFKIINQEAVEKPPKTENSYRKLHIPKIVMDEIKKRKKLIDGYKELFGDKFIDNNYVSCQPNGLPHALTSLTTYISKTCKKNGLPKITSHGLRHVFATILIEQGVSLPRISAVLGHSSIHTTFEIYCDVMEEKGKIIAFMNNKFAVEDTLNE